MGTIIDESAVSSVETSIAETAPPGRASRQGSSVSSSLPTVDEPDYVPPDFSGSRRRRIGSSFIEQFVAGHDASDVLRELVQNEFDGGGKSLTLTFGSRALEVVGSGRDITADGWERLSVIVGTGIVMGGAQAEVVAPKENGIGSKNFGLRSLFRFGDEIHVRSGGQVALLDLQTQETGRERDPAWRREKGVRLYVPYRETSTEGLEAFTAEREEHALALMAAGIPDTLVKLALSGKSGGLREVSIRSIRTRRMLQWRQDAKAGCCRVRGATMVSRSGRLTDGDEKGTAFQEIEFSRPVDIPAAHLARRFPGYFKVPGGRLKIAVSLPIARGRLDLGQRGHFYYPLKASASPTGCVVSVSAPFELNTDRTGINDHVWNDWLIDQAVELTVDLLKADSFARFGADAFKALIGSGTASTNRFGIKIAERLSSDTCWPTRKKGPERFAAAPDIVLPTEVAFDGFLGDERYLHPALAGDKVVRDLVAASGAKTFSLSSLVRLRCAGEDSKALQTKVGADANFHFTNYKASLAGLDRQKRLAAALSAFPRRLTKEHKADIRNTASTLSATLELRSAAELMIVERDLWNDCPEPESERLHPELVPFKAIASHCRTFDEEQWLIDAAERTASAAEDDRERKTLYRKLLTQNAPISRLVLTALRSNPVVKNQRGEWVAPANMVFLKKPLARILAPVVDAPSKEMLHAPGLIARLRIRDTLNGSDLVRFAAVLPNRPDLAERFEKLLADNLKLLKAGVVEELRALRCLMSRSGALAAPTTLHLDTQTNRLCIGNDHRIVAGTNDLVYRKLKVRTVPDVNTLIETITHLRDRLDAPPRPDLLYRALVAAIARERRAKAEISKMPICWVQNGYHAPSTILVGTRMAPALAEAIPVYRHLDDTGRAYLDLGAAGQPNDAHWARFFRHVGTNWAPDAPLDVRRRRILLDAYQNRGPFGLPEGLNDVRCLIDDRCRLFSLADLRAGRLVEPDFHALQQALRNADSTIGIVEASERSRVFFSALGIRPLSSIAGTGEPVFGAPGRPQLWYKPKHSERVLSMLHRPIFVRALYEIAYRHRYGQLGFIPSDLDSIEARAAAIRDIAFFDCIVRRYSVGGIIVHVPTEIAVDRDRIGLVAPKTKNAFQFMLAEALAEIAGASSAATMRSLANAFLPLVLCGTRDELCDYLDRIDLTGHRHWESGESEGAETKDDDDVEEEALRQVFDNLNTDAQETSDAVQPVQVASATPTNGTASMPPRPPPFVLPDIEEVALAVSSTKGVEVEAREPSSSQVSPGYSGVWLPPTPAEIERAELVGRQGEELVYRMELQRVRDMGYSEPERVVIWTSRTEPGADHDIRSIDEDGRSRWIEVKSTTGVDGRFDWPRREFEKALRERERYELWRVYRVADRSPVAKCFRNPARLIGTRQIALELGCCAPISKTWADLAAKSADVGFWRR